VLAQVLCLYLSNIERKWLRHWKLCHLKCPSQEDSAHKDSNRTMTTVTMADREVVPVFDPPCGEGAGMMLGVSFSLLVMSRFVSRRRLHGGA